MLSHLRTDKQFAGLLGLGVALRLLIAPFSLQTDMLAVYWRSHLIAFDNAVYAKYLVNMGAHYVHALWLLIVSPILPDEQVLWSDPWWWSDSGSLAPQYLLEFANRPDVFSTILLLKLPYLLLDLLCGLLLVGMNKWLFEAPNSRKRLLQGFAFWMLSPIGLYASAAFGRYEMFAVVLVVGALWAAENGRWTTSALLLGVAITMRGYPLLLVPIFALFSPTGWWRSNPEEDRLWFGRLLSQILWMVVSLIPFGLIMFINQIIGDTVGELATLKDYHTGSTFLEYKIKLTEGLGDIYIFGVAAVVYMLVLLGFQYGWFGKKVEVRDLWVWLFVFHTLMFALATFSVHYFVWFTPFVILSIMRRPDWAGIGWLHIMQVLVVFILGDVYGGPSITLGLFSPISPEMILAAPNLRDILIVNNEELVKIAGLLRTIFIGISFVLIYPATKYLSRKADGIIS